MCKAVENKRGDAFLDAELERRYMVTHTNPTVKQTEDVIKYKLDTTARPQEDIITMTDEEIQGLKDHIAKCIINRDDTRAVQVRNPCAPFLFDIIPTLFPIARSKVHYFLKLINAVARFYPDEMMTMERDGKTYGLVTPKHNWLAAQIYLDTFVTECLLYFFHTHFYQCNHRLTVLINFSLVHWPLYNSNSPSATNCGRSICLYFTINIPK